MTALSSYFTGTVTVSAGGTTVTGTGTIWSGVNVKPGDVLQIGNFQSVISDVTDVTHLVIPPWGGGAQTAVAYKIWQVSPQRFAGSESLATVNELVAAFNTSGFYFFVDVAATEPDPSLGNDGQYAFQPTSGKTWVMIGGVWTYLGIYKAFQFRGAWNSGTAYAVGDVVTLSGSSYVCVLDHTNHTPPNTTYWQLLASVGSTGATPLLPVAAWLTATAYVAGPPASYVTNGGSSYMCLVSHTSGTFATDLAAGKWGLVAQGGTNGAGYGGTSTTSLAIGTGSKGFTTQAGLAYTNGARVRASSAANTANWMEGIATYSGTTLTINVDKTNGSGTLADWNFNVIGEPGAGGAVTSIVGNTGAFTLSHGLTNSTNDLQIDIGTQRSYLAGLTLSTAGSSSTFSVAAGVAVDDSNSDFMKLTSSISKTTSAWAVGSGNGALDTGAIANSTWYHVYEIKRPDTGVVDVLISTSASSPTMPTNYTLKRRIGSVKTNGSAQWTAFTQNGDEFLWLTPVNDLANVNRTTTSSLDTLTVPTGVVVNALALGSYTNTAAAGTVALISAPDMGVQVANTPTGNFTLYCSVAGNYGQASINVRTNTSAQVRTVSSAAANNGLILTTYGWIDRRGKDN